MFLMLNNTLCFNEGGAFRKISFLKVSISENLHKEFHLKKIFLKLINKYINNKINK